MGRRIPRNLSEQEMQIEPRFTSFFDMMMNVAHSNVLLHDPEYPLQLPSIAQNVAEGHCFHACLGGEEGHEVTVMNEGNHDDIDLEGRNKDSVALVTDIFFPTKFPIGRIMEESCQFSEEPDIGFKRPIHIPDDEPVSGETT